jgi:hypothetical protein
MPVDSIGQFILDSHAHALAEQVEGYLALQGRKYSWDGSLANNIQLGS